MMTDATFQDSTADRQAKVGWRGRQRWVVAFQQWTRHTKSHVTTDEQQYTSMARAMKAARDWTKESWERPEQP